MLFRSGMTLMVSSHILAELEEYCTEMLILRDGRIVEHHAAEAAAPDAIRLRVSLAAPPSDWRERLGRIEGIEVLETGEASAVLGFRGDLQGRHDLLARLLGQGLPVCGFAEDQLRLQDAYLATVGGEARSTQS